MRRPGLRSRVVVGQFGRLVDGILGSRPLAAHRVCHRRRNESAPCYDNANTVRPGNGLRLPRHLQADERDQPQLHSRPGVVRKWALKRNARFLRGGAKRSAERTLRPTACAAPTVGSAVRTARFIVPAQHGPQSGPYELCRAYGRVRCADHPVHSIAVAAKSSNCGGGVACPSHRQCQSSS